MPVERIVGRLKTAEYLLPLKAKIHSVRLILAGDYSEVDDGAPSQRDPLAVPPSDLKRFYDVIVRDFQEGTSNILLQSVRTLMMQTAYTSPDVQFEDVSPEEATVNALYIEKRLGPAPRGCNAAQHMKQALLDHIISGYGWIWTSLRNGKPNVMSVDTLDCSWDLSATLMPDIRWVSCTVRQPLWYWLERYPKQKARFIDHVGASENMEQIVELEHYWDIDGEAGTAAVFFANSWAPGATWDTIPIEYTENPHYYEVDGQKLRFLPLEPIYFMQLPSVRHATSLVEMAIANQMAIRKAEAYMDQVVEAGKPFYEIEKDALDDTEFQKLEESEVGTVIKRNVGKKGIEEHNGMAIPDSVGEYHSNNKGELISNLGVDPYASGNKVDGISYATEVNAIQASSGLTAATIAKNHAEHWQRVISKSLANGATYDVKPIDLTYEGVPLKFHEGDPIKLYLRPDAKPTIADDTMQFRSRDQRIQAALQVLNVCSNPVILQKFPEALENAFVRFLRAIGEQNIDSWTKEPPAPPQPAGPPPGIMPPPPGAMMPPPGMMPPGAMPGLPPRGMMPLPVPPGPGLMPAGGPPVAPGMLPPAPVGR
jgi:hypothetical protein